MPQRIIFVLNSISITRCQKRVQEFIDHGYQVDVYGFERGGEIYAKPSNYNIETIGVHPITMSYYKRLYVITKALRKLHKRYRHEKDVIFYYFFFDVAFAASLISKRPYIYEESDIPYANIRNNVLRNYLKRKDRDIITKSILTIMTSEGFIKYHNLENKLENIIIVPNRVNPDLLHLSYKHKELDINHLSIGFVGGFRYQSVMNFAQVVGRDFPYVDFHVFGDIKQNNDTIEELDKQCSNIHLHGIFKNPQDLPSVYEQIDLVLATYDVTSVNAQYAEPNKMYESIFFRVPIIVSKGTFLSEKVKELSIGYSINGLDIDEIRRFLSSLKIEDIKEKQMGLAKINQREAINYNPRVYEYLNEEFNK